MAEDREPSINSLLSGGGFGALRNLDKKFKAQLETMGRDRARLAEIAWSVYRTEEGRELIEALIDMTLRRAAVPDLGETPMVVTFDQLAPMIVYREGQNSVGNWLLELLAAHERAAKSGG